MRSADLHLLHARPIDRFCRSPIAWLIVGTILFLSFLGRVPMTSDHELRVAETAATMARSGWPWDAQPVTVRTDTGRIAVNPWLVPVFDRQIRLQKPPLPYWAVAVVYRIIGEGPAAARLPSALLGIVALALVYRLGRLIGGRNVGLLAMAGWISTHFVVDEFRKSMADPYLACFTLAAVVAWVEASLTASRRRANLAMLGFYAAVAIGFGAKLHIILLHLAIAIAAFSFAYRRWPRTSLWTHPVGLLIWAAIALPWPVYVAMNVPDAMGVLRAELDKDRNPRPIFFYLHSPFLMSLPWTYAFIAAIALAFLRRSRALRFVLLWLAGAMLVFSFAHMKKNAYLLPAVPAVVIAAAIATAKGVAFARLGRRPDQVRLVALGHTIAGVGVAIAIGVLSMQRRSPDATSLVAAIIVGVVCLLVSLVPLLVRPERAFDQWVKFQALAFAVMVLLFLSFPDAAKKDRARADEPTTRAATDAIESSL